MHENGALKRLPVDEAHGLAREEVQTVHVGGIGAEGDFLLALVKENNGLKHSASAVLDILTQRVQVGGEDNACGEDALVILALALAVELLEPLRHHGVGGFIGNHDFHGLALAVEDVADRRVLVAVVGLEVVVVQLLLRGLSALHERVDVSARNSDGKQTDSREDGESAADVVGYDEGLIAFLVSQRLEGASCLVGGAVDALTRAFLAVLLLEHLAEYAERDRRLGGGARLGNHVDRDVLALAKLHDLGKRRGADGVTREEDLRGILAGEVVVLRGQKLYRGARAEIGTADADNNEHVGVLFDFLGSRLDAGELLFVIVCGKIQPADEVVAQACAVMERLVRSLDLSRNAVILVLADKAF